MGCDVVVFWIVLNFLNHCWLLFFWLLFGSKLSVVWLLLLWLMFWLGAVGPFAVVCIGLSFILKVSPNRKKKNQAH